MFYLLFAHPFSKDKKTVHILARSCPNGLPYPFLGHYRQPITSPIDDKPKWRGKAKNLQPIILQQPSRTRLGYRQRSTMATRFLLYTSLTGESHKVFDLVYDLWSHKKWWKWRGLNRQWERKLPLPCELCSYIAELFLKSVLEMFTASRFNHFCTWTPIYLRNHDFVRAPCMFMRSWALGPHHKLQLAGSSRKGETTSIDHSISPIHWIEPS